MDAQSNPVSVSVRELEQEITCGICHGHFQEPKIFPCCHYYCKQCIIGLARQSQPSQSVPCPDCREPVILPEKNPDINLPTAFFINRMKEVFYRMEKARGKMEVVCEMCSGGDEVVAFCRQCTQFICDDCVKCHQKIKIFAHHSISTLDDLKRGGLRELHLESDNVPPTNCESHSKAKKLYCFDCSQPICRDCIVIDHAGHRYEFVKKVAQETKKNFCECIVPLKESVSSLQSALVKIKETKSAIKSNGHSITEKADTLFQELHDIIDDCKKQLLKELQEIVEKKIKALSSQKKGLNTSLGNVQSLVDFVERTLENANDEEIVTLQGSILNRVETEKQKEVCVAFEPSEAADIGIGVSVAENLREICKVNSRLFPFADPSKCTVEGDGIVTAEVSKVARVYVKCHQFNGMPANDYQNVVLEVRSLVDQSVFEIQGAHCHRNEYVMEYTPMIHGCNQLTILVNGAPISKSPFLVQVGIPPSVKVIKGAWYPPSKGI